MSMTEDFTRAIKIAAAIETAEKAARKQALLDAAGDVCERCREDEPPDYHLDDWWHENTICDAWLLHRRIKEEDL